MKRARLSFVSLSSVFLLLCSGCATTGDLNKVESKLLTLREEFETVRNKQARILGELTRLQADLNGFKGVFDSFQKKGQYNFANIGVKMDELRTLHQELLGKHQMLQTEFEKLSEQHKKLLQSYGSRFGDPTAAPVSSSG